MVKKVRSPRSPQKSMANRVKSPHKRHRASPKPLSKQVHYSAAFHKLKIAAENEDPEDFHEQRDVLWERFIKEIAEGRVEQHQAKEIATTILKFSKTKLPMWTS